MKNKSVSTPASDSQHTTPLKSQRKSSQADRRGLRPGRERSRFRRYKPALLSTRPRPDVLHSASKLYGWETLKDMFPEAAPNLEADSRGDKMRFIALALTGYANHLEVRRPGTKLGRRLIKRSSLVGYIERGISGKQDLPTAMTSMEHRTRKDAAL